MSKKRNFVKLSIQMNAQELRNAKELTFSQYSEKLTTLEGQKVTALVRTGLRRRMFTGTLQSHISKCGDGCCWHHYWTITKTGA
jgi:hypothetical protein